MSGRLLLTCLPCTKSLDIDSYKQMTTLFKIEECV